MKFRGNFIWLLVGCVGGAFVWLCFEFSQTIQLFQISRISRHPVSFPEEELQNTDEILSESEFRLLYESQCEEGKCSNDVFDQYIPGNRSPIQILIRPKARGLCDGSQQLLAFTEISGRFLDRIHTRREEHKNAAGDAIKNIFVLGVPTGLDVYGNLINRTEYLRDISEEADKYDDILLGDLEDAYQSLPLKTELFLQWVSTECMNVLYVFKKDEDVFINWGLLAMRIQRLILDPKIMVHWEGCVYVDSMPVIHDPTQINYENISMDIFPPYTAGPGYYLSRAAVNQLYEARQKYLKDFRNEDAMLGLLGNTTGLRPNDGFSSFFWVESGETTVEMLRKCDVFSEKELRNWTGWEMEEPALSLKDRTNKCFCSKVLVFHDFPRLDVADAVRECQSIHPMPSWPATIEGLSRAIAASADPAETLKIINGKHSTTEG